MLRSLLITMCLTAIIATTFGADVCAAAPASPPATPAANDTPDEGWSLDDIKDVCEGVHFIAITIGIGVGLYWFCLRYVPRERSSRIEFNVDTVVVGEQGSCRLVEVVAIVNNLSRCQARLTECRFTIASVTFQGESPGHGTLEKLNVLVPLFAGEWVSSRTAIDAGTSHRLACAASIPRDVRHVVVTGHLRHDGRAEPYSASRLAAIG